MFLDHFTQFCLKIKAFLSSLKELNEISFLNINLPPVHVVEQHLQLPAADVFEVDYGLVHVHFRLTKEVSEKGGADGKHQLVGWEGLVGGGQRHIRQERTATQGLSQREEDRMVIIPFQAKIFITRPHFCSKIHKKVQNSWFVHRKI